VVATLDEVGRFASAGQVKAYVGLVPRERSSGEQQRRGPLTKAGNRRVWWLLVQAAWHARGVGDRDGRVLRDAAARHARASPRGRGRSRGSPQGAPADAEERPAGRRGTLRGRAARDLPRDRPRARRRGVAPAGDPGPAASLRARADRASERREGVAPRRG